MPIYGSIKAVAPQPDIKASSWSRSARLENLWGNGTRVHHLPSSYTPHAHKEFIYVEAQKTLWGVEGKEGVTAALLQTLKKWPVRQKESFLDWIFRNKVVEVWHANNIFHTSIYFIWKVIVLDIFFQAKYAKNLKYIQCHFTVNWVNPVKLLLLFQLNETNYCMRVNYQENQLPINRQQICITIHTLNNEMFLHKLQLIS